MVWKGPAIIFAHSLIPLAPVMHGGARCKALACMSLIVIGGSTATNCIRGTLGLLTDQQNEKKQVMTVSLARLTELVAVSSEQVAASHRQSGINSRPAALGGRNVRVTWFNWFNWDRLGHIARFDRQENSNKLACTPTCSRPFQSNCSSSSKMQTQLRSWDVLETQRSISCWTQNCLCFSSDRKWLGTLHV